MPCKKDSCGKILGDVLAHLSNTLVCFDIASRVRASAKITLLILVSRQTNSSAQNNHGIQPIQQKRLHVQQPCGYTGLNLKFMPRCHHVVTKHCAVMLQELQIQDGARRPLCAVRSPRKDSRRCVGASFEHIDVPVKLGQRKIGD